jgi:hypothetical protein
MNELKPEISKKGSLVNTGPCCRFFETDQWRRQPKKNFMLFNEEYGASPKADR